MRKALNASVLTCLMCAACASSPVRPEPSAVSLPAVPEDPLALLVEAPDSVAVANVQALTGTSSFARLRPYIERAACVSLDDWASLLASTRRAALAARQKPEQSPEWLLLLAGRYTEADAGRLLAVAMRSSRGGDNEPAREARDQAGRFAVTEQGELAVSVLEERVLVLGTKAWLHAALVSVSQPTGSFLGSTLWRSVGVPLGCEARSACVLSAAHTQGAHQLERSLSSAGARQVGQALESSDSALGLTFSNQLTLALAVQLSSEETAQLAERALRDWLWQANLVVRLTGLPAVLDRTRLSTQGAQLRGELDVTAQELDAYDAKGRALLDRLPTSCDAQLL